LFSLFVLFEELLLFELFVLLELSEFGLFEGLPLLFEFEGLLLLFEKLLLFEGSSSRKYKHRRTAE